VNKKRNSLKKISGVGVVAAATSQLWVKPVVNAVVLPAHAQASCDVRIVSGAVRAPRLI